MKNYLKMADVFQWKCEAPAESDDEMYCGMDFCAEFTSRKKASYAAHAINSHDELVQMNQELLATLAACKEALEGCYDVTEWPASGHSTCDNAIAVAVAVIAKAKGGEA